MKPSGPPRFEPGSFRDPDTRVFHHDGAVFRALTARALTDWRQLADTRFYGRMTEQGHLVGTREVTGREDLPALAPTWVAVLEHARIPVISYPYEWSFGMLQDAALLQLDVTLAALDEDMTLKDATPFNVQWTGARPTFIDLGSFTAYEPGDPWAGYRQFCETFLYPLFLQAYRNAPFHPWLRGRLDGMTAGECRALLSARDCLRPGVLAHVYLQAKAQTRYEDSDDNVKAELHAAGFGAALIRNNVARLRRTVAGLRWTPARSTWSEYTREHAYDDADLERKASFVRRVLGSRRWSLVWDVGCNTGTYSRMAAGNADYVLALDADHVVIDRLYRTLREEGQTTILPLVADLADPSPGLGWRGRERRPLADRCCARAHPVPGAGASPGHRPQHSARRLHRLAGGLRRRGGPGVRRSGRPDGEASAAPSRGAGVRLLARGGRSGAGAALRPGRAGAAGVRNADRVPLPAESPCRRLGICAAGMVPAQTTPSRLPGEDWKRCTWPASGQWPSRSRSSTS